MTPGAFAAAQAAPSCLGWPPRSARGVRPRCSLCGALSARVAVPAAQGLQRGPGEELRQPVKVGTRGGGPRQGWQGGNPPGRLPETTRGVRQVDREADQGELDGGMEDPLRGASGSWESLGRVQTADEGAARQEAAFPALRGRNGGRRLSWLGVLEFREPSIDCISIGRIAICYRSANRRPPSCLHPPCTRLPGDERGLRLHWF
jgi:hypothetical protein